METSIIISGFGGQGTLFAQSHLLFGDAARNWTINFIDGYSGFLLAILPPGAFIGLGLLIAAKNVLDHHRQKRTAPIGAGEMAEQA